MTKSFFSETRCIYYRPAGVTELFNFLVGLCILHLRIKAQNDWTGARMCDLKLQCIAIATSLASFIFLAQNECQNNVKLSHVCVI